MPSAKPKPSDVASEAKRTWIPYIAQNRPDLPAASWQIQDSAAHPVEDCKRVGNRLRVAVIDGDPVDVALDWAQYMEVDSDSSTTVRIPVVNMANEKRPGGDWESGLLAPEECFCRRSNLIHALLSSTNYPHREKGMYPLPQRGGIYSPHVAIFRDGPEQYQMWSEFKSVPVISVAPIRRPKLDEGGKHYSFSQEQDLMLEKMRAVLRMAAMFGHTDIVMGAFGVGHVFRNPPREVARMWRALLFHDPEFCGVFSNVVFAVQKGQPGNGKSGVHEHDVFLEEFDPSKVYEFKYLQNGTGGMNGVG